MLDPKVVRSRLAFIRHLYRVAVEQADQPEPQRAASVLTFHDAGELFLGLALEHSGVVVPGKQDVKFLDYWELLGKATPPVQLLGKTQMNKLNLARVALKHHGQLPAPSTVEEARGSVTSFLKDGCTDVFGVDFDSISMVDLVAFVPVREHLVRAEHAIAASDFKRAAEQLALAFAKLLIEYDVAAGLVEPPPFPLVREGRFSSLDEEYRWASSKQARHWTAASMNNLAAAVRVLALGLDYRRYRRFRALIPAAWREMSGTIRVAPPRGAPPTREQCEDCLAFVVDSALRVQE